MYFTGLGMFSERYIRNPYLFDLRRAGYHQGNLPKGWPSGLNIDHLFTKLTATCP
jgi:hypothetical protein